MHSYQRRAFGHPGAPNTFPDVCLKEGYCFLDQPEQKVETQIICSHSKIVKCSVMKVAVILKKKKDNIKENRKHTEIYFHKRSFRNNTFNWGILKNCIHDAAIIFL